jgi:HD-like signal output (HDOD) protein/prolyl-tRNA editing enzyme YbaK/EbsC (Cys-tRNA(Pro) deacylase)
MAIPLTIRQFLDKQGVGYEEFYYPEELNPVQAAAALGIRPDQVAIADVLHDQTGIVLAIYPASFGLDLTGFNREMGRSLKQIASSKLPRLLTQVHGTACLPLAGMYGLEALVHETLAAQDSVFFSAVPGTMVGLKGWDFNLLQGPAWYDGTFARPGGQQADPGAGAVKEREERRARIRNRLQNVTRLPAMPGIAHQLLQLSVNPYANASDLAAIVEQDASLAAQLIRYANSPFYNYRGDVDSVRDAIARVLGFDMVMDMALGIAVGKAFRIPRGGPLGLDAFWRHSTYAAVLAQRLAGTLSSSKRPRPGMAYLAGLLHNFGFLALGQLFPEDYKILAAAASARPDEAIGALERELLGVSHQEIGGWLMEAWNMPSELIVTVREHHNEQFRGDLAVYPNLVLIANRMLKTLNVGDEPAGDLPGELLWTLGLSEDDALYAFDSVIQNRDGLDFMALQMAA